MSRTDIIRLALEAGLKIAMPADGDLPDVWHVTSTAELERFAELVAAAERARLMSAQLENNRVELDVQRRALRMSIMAEREACAQILDANAKNCTTIAGPILEANAAAIRARGAP